MPACSAVGGSKHNDPTRSFRLASGDALVLAGEARLAFHGRRPHHAGDVHAADGRRADQSHLAAGHLTPYDCHERPASSADPAPPLPENRNSSDAGNIERLAHYGGAGGLRLYKPSVDIVDCEIGHPTFGHAVEFFAFIGKIRRLACRPFWRPNKSFGIGMASKVQPMADP